MERSLRLAIGIAVVFLFAWTWNRLDATALRGQGASTAVGKAAYAGKKVAGIVREVTAYNVGVRGQTNDDPCLGARGHDLCAMVERGDKVCAANFVALGTVLKIEKYGECVVLDRMHRRHGHRVDIAMAEAGIEEAREFGLQRRVVEVKN